MKWPNQVVLIRHGQSAYNVLRVEKEKDPLYQEFKKVYQENFQSPQIMVLARKIRTKYHLKFSDYNTPLTDEGKRQAVHLGMALRQAIGIPDIIYFSPYLRTKETLNYIFDGWPLLSSVKRNSENRIREQEHGVSLLYSDWRLFHVFHPEQKELYELLGPYWYQYPQGESISQVEDRIRLMISTLIREHSGQKILLITHHLTILSFRSIMERLSPEQFIELDEKQKPVNCGTSIYNGNPKNGKDGKLKLSYYNVKLW